MPGNRQVFSTAMNAADRFRWDRQWTEAAKEYQRALAEFPDDAAARGGLGFCYMQTKQWKKALDEYEYILKQDPSNVIALSKTAELYVILNRRDDAYKAYLHLAELYSQAGQGARAEATWQKAVQLSPAHPEPHERLASYYMGKEDFATIVQERLAAARGYLARNDKAAVRMQCEEVLRVDATNTQAQQLLAQLSSQPSGPLPPGAGAAFSAPKGSSSGPLASGGNASTDLVSLSNTSGGNTGIMGNMRSAGNFSGGGNPGPAIAGGGIPPTLHKRITASQVTGVLRQAQTFQTQGHFTDAIDLCEQIIESGFDRPDARYFLGWLYQEQRRWDDAIRQFQTLLNDPDYALSCYYALGQCYRAKGDLRTATMHFDEAVDRVNLDALTMEESDQLVQLCQEAAGAHRLLGEQEQALTVYNALLGFLRSRGWNDKVAQVEFMLKQAQNTPLPPRPPASTPLPPTQQGNTTRVLPPEQVTMMQQPPMAPNGASMPDAATMAFPMGNMPPASVQKPPSAPLPPGASNSLGELPDWLTGILNDAEKTQVANKQAAQSAQPVQQVQPVPPQATVANQATMQQQVVNGEASPSWLTEGAQPANTANSTKILPPEQVQQVVAQAPIAPPPPPAPIAPPPPPQEVPAPTVVSMPAEQIAQAPVQPVVAAQPVQPVAQPAPAIPVPVPEPQAMLPVEQKASAASAEVLLSQIAGASSKDGVLKNVADSLLSSTVNLPDNVRVQVVQSMQDIQRYIDHGLLTPATEECLKVIDIAPQYLDIHQVLCEIYVRQGKVEQAITKYGILIDTYVVNGRIDDAISTYRRILQLEPNNLTYRVRLINLLATRGNKEELLRERSLAAESYLRLGYMDRALTELEQAIDAYQFAIRDSSYEVMARTSSAQCLLTQGKPEAAIQQLEQALQSVRNNARGSIDPSVWAARPREEGEEHQAPEVEISLLLAKAYGRIGKQEQMQAILRQVKQTTTYHDEVTSALAEISARQGDFDSALQEYADVVHYYRSNRQTDNALSVLREMVHLAPQDPRAHAELGDT